MSLLEVCFDEVEDLVARVVRGIDTSLIVAIRPSARRLSYALGPAGPPVVLEPNSKLAAALKS